MSGVFVQSVIDQGNGGPALRRQPICLLRDGKEL